MFRKSLAFVGTVMVAVVGLTFFINMRAYERLPSRYDPGISVETAFRTSKHPLLIEFYTDDCTTCRRLTPELHKLYTERFRDRLTLVMVDLDDPANRQVAALFGVTRVPDVYVFDFRRMKKHPVAIEGVRSTEDLRRALAAAAQKA